MNNIIYIVGLVVVVVAVLSFFGLHWQAVAIWTSRAPRSADQARRSVVSLRRA